MRRDPNSLRRLQLVDPVPASTGRIQTPCPRPQTLPATAPSSKTAATRPIPDALTSGSLGPSVMRPHSWLTIQARLGPPSLASCHIFPAQPFFALLSSFLSTGPASRTCFFGFTVVLCVYYCIFFSGTGCSCNTLHLSNSHSTAVWNTAATALSIPRYADFDP